MSSLFEDLKEGLEEAIAYEKGYGAGRVKTYMILPVKEYSGKEIRDIRTKAGMTQSVFASYMGVSIKTVEAWEGGRTHPTGPVFRLLDILSKNEEMEYIVAKWAWKWVVDYLSIFYNITCSRILLLWHISGRMAGLLYC